ncbi:MAG: hypothetical protein ACRDOJ_06375 [Nocardioidaceae bacterium]
MNRRRVVAHARRTAADALMLTGTVLFCPDCADERIFVVPDCGDDVPDCGDYCCSECGAAVSVIDDLVDPGSFDASRVA